MPACKPLSNPSIRSIALINPLGDFGISSYTYELAEGIAANGVPVDVYTSDYGPIAELPRHHRIFPVLGGVLFKQRRLLGGDAEGAASTAGPHQPRPAGTSRSKPSGTNLLRRRLRELILPVELACHLKRRGYSCIWTQWPDMEGYGTRFWAVCRALGLRVVHTVHNVLPHEEMLKDRAVCKAVYARSNVLVVHSKYAAEQLAANFPEVEEKTIISRHGLYTIYPRVPQERERMRTSLGIAPEQVAILVFGGIRPYKNTDSVIHALKSPKFDRTVLVVAGYEAGYPDLIPGMPLGRAQRLAEQVGVMDKIRFMPGPHSILQTSSIFEAADGLILPYFESYGSGALLLGMTFGKYILATPTGGMEEYLAEYPTHTILKSATVADIQSGLEEAQRKLPGITKKMERDPFLEWGNLARKLLDSL